MKPEEQLSLWVRGISVHNHENDECCPDFSCCCSELLAEEFERKAFQRFYLENNGEACMQMLTTFLQRLILVDENCSVRVKL